MQTELGYICSTSLRLVTKSNGSLQHISYHLVTSSLNLPARTTKETTKPDTRTAHPSLSIFFASFLQQKLLSGNAIKFLGLDETKYS